MRSVPDGRLMLYAKDHQGRSHRAKEPKVRIQEVIHKSATILNLPKDYVCGIVPASDTGAGNGDVVVTWCPWLRHMRLGIFWI